MGIQTPPKSTPTGGAQWTQGGCLIAFLIACITLVGICGIAATVIYG